LLHAVIAGRRDVLPVGSVVARDVDETIVSPYPDGLRIDGRRADGVDDAEAVVMGCRCLGGDDVESF